VKSIASEGVTVSVMYAQEKNLASMLGGLVSNKWKN
jgi:hypothetical protein